MPALGRPPGVSPDADAGVALAEALPGAVDLQRRLSEVAEQGLALSTSAALFLALKASLNMCDSFFGGLDFPLIELLSGGNADFFCNGEILQEESTHRCSRRL